MSDKKREWREELADDGSGAGLEVDENEGDISDPFDPNQIEIISRPFTVSEVLDRLAHKEINLAPDFQREASIWRKEQKSRLIESLLLRIPLPVFYIATDENDNWLVVDGLQRITTLKQFVLDKTLTLERLEFLSDFNECGFDDLPRVMQRRVRETQLMMHVIQPKTPKSVTRTIFKRINTGGLPLSAQEIRHALYQGNSTSLLKKLVLTPEYGKATSGGIRDSRMGGRECILRYLAFHLLGVEKYSRKDMDGFLCRVMDYINALPDKKLKQIDSDFRVSMARSADVLGKDAFRKKFEQNGRRFPINKALFEVWSVTLGRLSEEEFNVLKKKRKSLDRNFMSMMNEEYVPENVQEFKDMSFMSSISQETSDPRKVRYRFYALQGLVKETLEE